MSKYANWSREALIAKITSLESARSNPSLSLDSSAPGATSWPAQEKSPSRRKSAKRSIDFSMFSTRRVAIRFAYLGWNYHGLAYQREGPRTVEGEILKAFYATRMIPSMDPDQCNFSRCGRTDADVSAMAQVISLDLRSVIPKDKQTDHTQDEHELDYLKPLNSHLPADILAYQICLRPPAGFDARFSCVGRQYRYYFDGSALNVSAMQDAADRLVGEHDFRNFCRIDGSKQITNFHRRVTEAKICKEDGPLHYLSLRGNAFLWNQVRSIMAVLFLVGQNRESPEIVDKLLDVIQTPRRPAYEIAWGVPLVLYDCEFGPLEWRTSRGTSVESAMNLWHELRQKETIARLLIDKAMPFSVALTNANLLARINIGHGVGRRSSRYVPLKDRPVADEPEVANQKWIDKKMRKVKLQEE